MQHLKWNCKSTSIVTIKNAEKSSIVFVYIQLHMYVPYV